MNNNYEFLVEKEEMWARMLMEVLDDNDIPYTAVPVYGALLVMKAGKKEIYKIYVAAEKLEEATALLQILFSEDAPE